MAFAFPTIKSNESVSFRPGGFTVTQGRSTPSRSSIGATRRPQYERVDPEILMTPAQEQAQSYLTESLREGPKPIAAETAYNPFADQLRTRAEQYSQQEMNPLYGQAQDVLSGTLTGQFDPTSSQYYQGFREQQDLNLADALNRYGRQQYLKGGLRSTATDTGQARLIAESNAARNQLLGQLAMQERQNQLNAVNQSLALGQAQDQFIRGQIGMLSDIGGQLQATEQGALDRARQEQLRQQQQQLDLADLLFNAPVTYAYPQYRETPAATQGPQWTRVETSPGVFSNRYV